MIRTDEPERHLPAASGMPADPDIRTHCAWESWSVDLATCMIRIGKIARQRFGISADACGFLSLVNCSDPQDRPLILSLFEEASICSSSFCYSTVIENEKGERHAVFCIGESHVEKGAVTGHINGLFTFANFKV